MTKAIGIDLGTTNSVVGIKKLETDIIRNAEGDDLTPSVVGFQKKKGLFGSSQFIVGRPALDWMRQDPENTIVSVKRLMGRHFKDEDVQKALKEKHYPYTILALSSGSLHSVAVLLDGKEYTPEQISSKILEKIKKDCKKELGEAVEYAVVTVPAYFNDKQKHATRIAAAQAGLKVQRLLPEPTAAAISFGVDTLAEGEANTILVFDLGGGTFDISILTIVDGRFIEQGKGGDMWMGGDDIDVIIRDYVYRQTELENEIDDLSGLIEQLPTAEKNRFTADLKNKVETAKVRLSAQDSAFVEILGLLKDEDGDIVDIEVELSRTCFEALLEPFVDKCVELTRKIVESIDFEPDLIDKVIMVGGSSGIPIIVRRIEEIFGRDKILVHPRPMLAIAEGAAILAHRLADYYECPGCGQNVSKSDKSCENCDFDLMKNLANTGVVDIVHTTSHDYYLELEDGSGDLLVEKNTPLPFKTQGTFKLMSNEQRLAHFKFYNRVNDDQESIGDLWLAFDDPKEGLKPDQDSDKKRSTVQLDFEIDINNIIHVSAGLTEQDEVRASRTLSRGLADEKLFLNLEHAINEVNEAKNGFYVNIDFLHRAVGIARTINGVIDPDTGEESDAAILEAERQQQVARELVEKEGAVMGEIYYAEAFIHGYGHLLEKNNQERLQAKIQHLKDKNDRGSATSILAASDALNDEINKHGALLAVTDLDNAASLASVENPAKAPRYEKYHRDVHEALLKGETERFQRLMSEIMPEVNGFLNKQSKKELHISKGIQK